MFNNDVVKATLERYYPASAVCCMEQNGMAGDNYLGRSTTTILAG